MNNFSMTPCHHFQIRGVLNSVSSSYTELHAKEKYNISILTFFTIFHMLSGISWALPIYEKNPEISVVAKVEFPIFHFFWEFSSGTNRRNVFHLPPKF